MTGRGTPPKSPDGLREAGRGLWEDIQGAFSLDERETAVLLRACRLADVEQRLADELAVSEIVTLGSTGQQRVSQLVDKLAMTSGLVCRLLSSLDLPGSDEPKSQTSIRAGNAAAARWRNHNQVRTRREALRNG